GVDQAMLACLTPRTLFRRGFGGKMAAALVSAVERRPEAARREHFAAGRVLGRDFGSDRRQPDLTFNCRTAEATDQNQPHRLGRALVSRCRETRSWPRPMMLGRYLSGGLTGEP